MRDIYLKTQPDLQIFVPGPDLWHQLFFLGNFSLFYFLGPILTGIGKEHNER